MSSLALTTADAPLTGGVTRRRGRLTPWQAWGLILLAPYFLVFLLFVLYPVGYGFWLARHPDAARDVT